MKSIVKNIAVGLGAIALFLALSYGFVPQVLDGQIVNQSDISGFVGLSHEMSLTLENLQPRERDILKDFPALYT